MKTIACYLFVANATSDTFFILAGGRQGNYGERGKNKATPQAYNTPAVFYYEKV